ncbi:hypothetical protein EJ02DRAFT_465587 [Clathrospora elynae]|uniref:Nitronate monooxygenase domain-containing protein n=1 Tax=Clathrospora elynae TaxID=706981 RepID=A0A6A5SSR4_9PLEO|nr:hypothetical protein EJ02DRAFT_465587 [Clathrospora elynae]
MPVTAGSSWSGIARAPGIADSCSSSVGENGVAMGTRFLACSKGYQNEVVRATDGAQNTTKMMLYNHLRGTMLVRSVEDAVVTVKRLQDKARALSQGLNDED